MESGIQQRQKRKAGGKGNDVKGGGENYTVFRETLEVLIKYIFQN